MAFNYVSADEYLSGNIRDKINVLDEYIRDIERSMRFMDEDDTPNFREIEENLEGTKEQFEIAKEEVKKPFDKAEELKNKTVILAEINRLLDMGEAEDPQNLNPLIEDIKRAIIDYFNKEFGEDYAYDDFNRLFPDEDHIGLAYTTTEDGRHEIQYEISLKDYSWTQYVDDEEVSHASYLETEEGESISKEEALKNFKLDLEHGEFTEYVRVDKRDLKERLGLEIDDDGNFYDPLAKNLDNDGILDRYDNDFISSNYFESTYDVDGLKKEDKESTLGQLEKFKTKVKEESSLSQEEKEKDKNKGVR